MIKLLKFPKKSPFWRFFDKMKTYEQKNRNRREKGTFFNV